MADFMSYLQAFRARLQGDYVPSKEAERFVAYLRSKHPELLEDWMLDHTRQFVTIELGRMRRAERARFNAGAKSRSFAELAKKHMAGELDIKNVFQVEYVIDDKHTVRRFGEMRREDVLYVADSYEATGKRALLQAAFFKAVAKNLGTKKVSEQFTAEEILRLQERMLGKSKH